MTVLLDSSLQSPAGDWSPAGVDLAEERRRYARYPARGAVTLFRNSDKMRLGLATELWDAAVEGISIISPTALPVGEMLQMTLRNDLQRFAKNLRGQVRWCEPRTDGKFRIGIELLLRLSGGEIALVKRVGVGSETSGSPFWM